MNCYNKMCCRIKKELEKDTEERQKALAEQMEEEYLFETYVMPMPEVFSLQRRIKRIKCR